MDMAELTEPELAEYIFNDLFPMDTEINNWVNHDFWYTNQCIDHYDAERFAPMDLSLPPAPDTNLQPQLDQRTVSPLSTFSSTSIASGPQSGLENRLLVPENQSLSQTVPVVNVDAETPIPTVYLVDNERIFVTSPNISIQNSTPNVKSESVCSSPTAPASLTPGNDFDSMVLQENQMLNYLRSDKGIAAFAKAHELHKDDLVHFLEMKRHGEEFDNIFQKSPSESDEKSEGSHNKRRRHRGTYSKTTCLQVIEFVKKGYSARAAAKKFGIPKSTVHNWLHEDVSTRPEKGHRKKDLYLDKVEDGDHEHQKTVNELGNSLAQTSLKDENLAKYVYPFAKVKKEVIVKPRSLENSWESRPKIDQNSQLVRLLTSTSKMAEVKAEPKTEDIDVDFAGNDNYFDIDCDFDDLLHSEDWIGHDEWYKQQYLHHYDHFYKEDSANAKNRKCYGSYSNEHRLKATEYVRSGKTLSAAAKEFKIPKSTIHTWLNEGNTPCELPIDVENAVVDQIENIKDGDTSPNLVAIKKKAEEVAGPHNGKFRASFAWCRDFMKRHYMEKSEDVDSKRLCIDVDGHKPCINDLVSVLGLTSSGSEQVTGVTGSIMLK